MIYDDFLKELMDSLFAAETRRFKETIKQLCIRNDEIQGTKAGSFMFMGQVYARHDVRNAVPKRPTLHESMIDELLAYLRDKQTVQSDFQEIKQVLYSLTYQCNDAQELRDALPDCLAFMHKQTAVLKRQMNQRHFYFSNPRVERQYNKVLPKIEMYCGTHLIY